MKANDLTWDRIKELVRIASKNGNDFSLNINGSGDISVDITQSNNYQFTTQSVPLRDLEQM